MTVILGPVPCQICGLIVVWDGTEWRVASGIRRHVCGQVAMQSRGARRIAARRMYLAVTGGTLPPTAKP